MINTCIDMAVVRPLRFRPQSFCTEPPTPVADIGSEPDKTDEMHTDNWNSSARGADIMRGGHHLISVQCVQNSFVKAWSWFIISCVPPFTTNSPRFFFQYTQIELFFSFVCFCSPAIISNLAAFWAVMDVVSFSQAVYKPRTSYLSVASKVFSRCSCNRKVDEEHMNSKRISNASPSTSSTTHRPEMDFKFSLPSTPAKTGDRAMSTARWVENSIPSHDTNVKSLPILERYNLVKYSPNALRLFTTSAGESVKWFKGLTIISGESARNSITAVIDNAPFSKIPSLSKRSTCAIAFSTPQIVAIFPLKYATVCPWKWFALNGRFYLKNWNKIIWAPYHQTHSCTKKIKKNQKSDCRLFCNSLHWNTAAWWSFLLIFVTVAFTENKTITFPQKNFVHHFCTFTHFRYQSVVLFKNVSRALPHFASISEKVLVSGSLEADNSNNNKKFQMDYIVTCS